MSAWAWVDSFELGAAGVVDLLNAGASKVTGGLLTQTHYAADVYAQRVAAGVETGSALDRLTDPGARTAMAQLAGQQATAAGALNVAARKTVEQVGDAVAGEVGRWRRFLPWAVGGVVVVGAGVLAWRVAK